MCKKHNRDEKNRSHLPSLWKNNGRRVIFSIFPLFRPVSVIFDLEKRFKQQHDTSGVRNGEVETTNLKKKQKTKTEREFIVNTPRRPDVRRLHRNHLTERMIED